MELKKEEEVALESKDFEDTGVMREAEVTLKKLGSNFSRTEAKEEAKKLEEEVRSRDQLAHDSVRHVTQPLQMIICWKSKTLTMPFVSD